MNGSITLRPAQRKTLLHHYRHGTDPNVRHRAHILLLLDDGHAWVTIAVLLYTSSATINRWRKRFLAGGVEAVLGLPVGRRSRLGDWWVALVVTWITLQTPRDFGFVQSRWTCAVAAVILNEDHGLRVSAETIRRRLLDADLVWRRPRPVLRQEDPRRAAILRQLRRLLASLPAGEVAVFQDEVDLNTNPDIGAMWMRRGQQAVVETPGDNAKRYLAGSLNWRTGALLATEGRKRDADLFVRHLDDLRRHLRCYRVIHVICDNATFHDQVRCRKVRAYLKDWGHRIKVHYVPKRAPDTNPIERVWWHLREEITRNHRCQTIEELLDLVFAWLECGTPFRIETSKYPRPKAG